MPGDRDPCGSPSDEGDLIRRPDDEGTPDDALGEPVPEEGLIHKLAPGYAKLVARLQIMLERTEELPDGFGPRHPKSD